MWMYIYIYIYMEIHMSVRPGSEPLAPLHWSVRWRLLRPWPRWSGLAASRWSETRCHPTWGVFHWKLRFQQDKSPIKSYKWCEILWTCCVIIQYYKWQPEKWLTPEGVFSAEFGKDNNNNKKKNKNKNKSFRFEQQNGNWPNTNSGFSGRNMAFEHCFITHLDFTQEYLPAMETSNGRTIPEFKARRVGCQCELGLT